MDWTFDPTMRSGGFQKVKLKGYSSKHTEHRPRFIINDDERMLASSIHSIPVLQ